VSEAGRAEAEGEASDFEGRVFRVLVAVAAAILALGLAYALLAPWIVRYDARPGAPVGQVLGVIAAGLMIATLLYLPAKRSEMLGAPNRRLVLAHIVLGLIGAGVALAHSRLIVQHPPILVLLAFLGLLVTGLYGRVIASRRMGPTFGRGGNPFRPAVGPPESLRALMRKKRGLLARLEPAASEGTFALALSHWTRQPLYAVRYYALTLDERRRMRALGAAGYRSEMGALERGWRVAHLVLAWLAVLGLLAHVVTTLFFAQWAADDREVYWWYLRK
jgi:signal transduction histidine kinase